ncbi:hypothetical protein TWF281_007851 [Arthrobotrys megalospora]
MDMGQYHFDHEIAESTRKDYRLIERRWTEFQIDRKHTKDRKRNQKSDIAGRSLERFAEPIPEDFPIFDREVLLSQEAIIKFLEWCIEKKYIEAAATLAKDWNTFRAVYSWKCGGHKYPDIPGKEIKKWVDDKSKIFPAAKTKISITGRDLVSLLRHLWESDTHRYRHERLRVQLALMMQISAFTAIRPGSMIESDGRQGTGEVFKYKDVRIFAYNDPQAEELRFVVFLDVLYHKGVRGRETTTYALYMYANPSLCPVLLFLALGFTDNAFAELSEPSDLRRLRIPDGRDGLELQWKETVMEMPIFRKTMTRSYNGKISDTDPLTTRDFRGDLANLGFRAGYEHRLHPRCFRYGSSNAAAPYLTPDQLSVLMGHREGSKIWKQNYQDRRVSWKTQEMYLKDADDGAAFECYLTVLSSTRDRNAPSSLPNNLSTLYKRDKTWKESQRKCKMLKSLVQEMEKSPKWDLRKLKRLDEQLFEARRVRDNRRRKMRESLLKSHRRDHFQRNSSNAIQAQFSEDYNDRLDSTPRLQYTLEDRERLVRLFYKTKKTCDAWWEALSLMNSLAKRCEGNPRYPLALCRVAVGGSKELASRSDKSSVQCMIEDFDLDTDEESDTVEGEGEDTDEDEDEDQDGDVNLNVPDVRV